MCCLFGFHDYGHKLSRKQRSILLTTLATACEERGTDATGIAYNVDGVQHIYKRPIPAHKMWFRVPPEATVVMGHTRMTTQGSEKKNFNNHPFKGHTGDHSFSLAHNGVLHNDRYLKKKFKFPDTKIETDSYVAVQLVEEKGKLDFSSLQHMAEQLEGTFTITALSDTDELYIVKGNNPMCIYHFQDLGLYIYASTEEILLNALVQIPFRLGSFREVELFSGDILRIDAKGNRSQRDFDSSKIDYSYSWGFLPMGKAYSHRPYAASLWEDDTYMDDLRAVASCFGLYEDDIDAMLEDGLTLQEIEEYLYCG